MNSAAAWFLEIDYRRVDVVKGNKAMPLALLIATVSIL